MNLDNVLRAEVLVEYKSDSKPKLASESKTLGLPAKREKGGEMFVMVGDP